MSPFALRAGQAERAWVLVRVLYAVLAAMALSEARAEVSALEGGVGLPFYLAPLAGDPAGRLRLAAAVLAASAAAAAARPRWTLARALAAAALWVFVGGRYYLTHWGHVWHAWTVVAALLVFLPGAPAPGPSGARADRQSVLLVVWACQASLAVVYALAGGCKLAAAAWQAWHGEVHALSARGLAYLVAGRYYESGVLTDAGRALVENPGLSLVLYAPALLVESLAPLAPGARARHRAWGLAFVALHAGIWALMGVAFPAQAVLAGLLYLGSPFAPAWRDGGAKAKLKEG